MNCVGGQKYSRRMASEDGPDDEFIREKMWVSRPKGTHLSQSHKAPGDFSPLTRGDNSELGHVTLSPVSDDDSAADDPSFIYIYDDASPPQKSREQEAFERAVSDQVSRLIDFGIAKARPHVEKFWQEKARPAIKSKWDNRPRRRKGERQLPAAEPVVIEAEVVDSSYELVEAEGQYRQNMTSAEAQARYLMAMAAQAFSDEQMRIVTNANIDDGEGLIELERKLAELPPAQVAKMIENIEANPSLLIDEAFDLSKILRADREVDYLPIDEQRDE